MPRILFAFAGFILLGISAGVSGVVLPSQLADYHVDKVTFGVTFFTFSAGYLLASVANGALIRRLGARRQLAVGAGTYAVVALGYGLHPPFALLVLASVAFGFANGIIDAGLNAYLATEPGHERLLNLLHAFFGVGALIGPVFAAFLLNRGLPWQDVYLVIAVLGVPLVAGYALLYPSRVPVDEGHGAPLPLALRRPEVWLGALFLCLYVGVEVTFGNWSFSLLTQIHGQGKVLAGWVVSGYWLGLTVGRFVISPSTSRAGIGAVTMMYGCLVAVLLATALTWWGPGAAVLALGFWMIGFFLGPMFPTTIAVTPRLLPLRLVPTAVGLLVGASVIGGAFFPWLAGAIAQGIGLASLLPYAIVLGVLLLFCWVSLARRMRPAAPAPAERSVA